MPAAGESVPTVELVGEAGRIIVNVSDQDRYRRLGYRRPEQVQAEPEGGEDKALEEMKVDELKQLAKGFGLDGVDQMKKADLIAAIAEARAGGNESE